LENFEFFQSFLFPYINFAIFLTLAIYLLKKPVVNALAKKRSDYLTLLERANLAREEAERRHRELEVQLKNLDAEMTKMRDEMSSLANQEASAILASGGNLAEHLKREARRIAEAEITASKEAIRAEILQQVREKTAEELRRTLDDSRQHQILRQSLSDLPRIGARS
jgi:F-type H+-transporting ATPase subunit b